MDLGKIPLSTAHKYSQPMFGRRPTQPASDTAFSEATLYLVLPSQSPKTTTCPIKQQGTSTPVLVMQVLRCELSFLDEARGALSLASSEMGAESLLLHSTVRPGPRLHVFREGASKSSLLQRPVVIASCSTGDVLSLPDSGNGPRQGTLRPDERRHVGGKDSPAV